MKENFKTYFHNRVIRARMNGTKKKSPKKDSSKIILPGAHRATQNVNSNPATADAPSSSTYSPKG